MNEIEELENEGINTDDEDDEKLIEGADDIKEMKKDSTKFSKVLSELVWKKLFHFVSKRM